MPLHMLRAGLLAAIAIAAATGQQASAADLYGEQYYPGAERYVDEEPYPAAPHAYRPRDLHEDPPIRYTDRHAPYGNSAPGGGHYQDYSPGYDRRADACLPRWKVRNQLRRDGWVDLQPIDRNEGVVSLRARREETGRVFLLRVDRCSGEIIHARPHHLRSFGEAPLPYPRRSWY